MHRGEGATDTRVPGLFRYGVVRVGGLPIEHLTRLRAPRTLEEADALLRDRSALVSDASKLSDLLHEVIPGQSKAVRRKLLRLRRDLHNLRCPRSRDMAACPSMELAQRIVRFAKELDRWTARREAFCATYDAEIAEARTLMCDSFRDPDFQAGVRLSSRSLSAHLRPGKANTAAELDTKAEKGLLRYLTRAAAKATPFGRFCAVLPGVVEPADAPLTFDEDPGRKWSCIRANKRLMQLTLRHLLGELEARRQLPVRLNPTLTMEQGSLRFLSSFDRTEIFQTVSRNAAVDVVLMELRRCGAGNVETLASALTAMPELDAGQEEAEAYVDRLFEIGLLQLDLPGLANDPEWPKRLRRLTATMRGDRASEATALLSEVDAGVAAIREDGVKSGDEVVTGLEDGIRRTLSTWAGAEHTLQGPCVYEDASAAGWARVDSDHFSAALRGLRDLVEVLIPLGGDRARQAGLLRFFDAHFAADRVPLLDFYEAHVQHERDRAGSTEERSEAGGEAAARPNLDGGAPAALAHAASGRGPRLDDRIAEASRALLESTARKWSENPQSREIALNRTDLEAALSGLPERHDGPLSASIFVNWVPRPGDPAGGQVLVPRALSMLGFGKFFSRFLYLFPSEILEALGQVGAGADTVLAEIAGDQAFNANLRPPIQRAEIVYPNGDRAGCAEAIDISRLAVGPSESGDRLDLFDQVSGQRVVPLDLGFMNPLLRPPLYQLLRSFSPPSSSSVPLPGRPFLAGETPNEAQEGGTLRRPRITYERHVILARETWFLPPGRLPTQEPDESDASFFVRVRGWQAAVALPDVVYVRVVYSPGAEVREATARATENGADGALSEDGIDDERPGDVENAHARSAGEKGKARKAPPWWGDLRKPQYLDFRSPLLVRLLGRYGTLRGNLFLVFEEWLPDSSDLAATAPDRHWVSESIIQIDLDRGTDSRASLRTERRMASEVVHA